MNKDWSYKIIESHDGLGYIVYRISWDENLYKVEWLWKSDWVISRSNARVFVTQEEALSNLVIAKFRWKKETVTTSTKKSESEGRREKTSWSEL